MIATEPATTPDDKASSSVPGNDRSASDQPRLIADELTKLAALRDAGVLTPEEFEMQKLKLLS